MSQDEGGGLLPVRLGEGADFQQGTHVCRAQCYTVREVSVILRPAGPLSGVAAVARKRRDRFSGCPDQPRRGGWRTYAHTAEVLATAAPTPAAGLEASEAMQEASMCCANWTQRKGSF